jgi:hypothetical protein
MSDEKSKTNETVAAMGNKVLSDVPTGLAVVPKGANVAALARRMAGELVQNEMEFHCIACGWNKSLHFDPDEIEALGGNIRDYTGPCPGCSGQTLTPKDAFWGKDFPSMSALAAKNKRAEARVQAEEFVDVVAEKVGNMIPGMGIPSPTIEDPEAPGAGAGPVDKSDLPDEIDLSKLTPR